MPGVLGLSIGAWMTEPIRKGVFIELAITRKACLSTDEGMLEDETRRDGFPNMTYKP